jgi:hypothetical protein
MGITECRCGCSSSVVSEYGRHVSEFQVVGYIRKGIWWSVCGFGHFNRYTLMRISSNRRILRNLLWCVYVYNFNVLTCRSCICVMTSVCCQEGLYVHKEIIACNVWCRSPMKYVEIGFVRPNNFSRCDGGELSYPNWRNWGGISPFSHLQREQIRLPKRGVLFQLPRW